MKNCFLAYFLIVFLLGSSSNALSQTKSVSQVINATSLTPKKEDDRYIDGEITFTNAEIKKMTNGTEYLVIENPKFNEKHKKYKSIINELPYNIEQPTYISTYLDVWQKYSKFKTLRFISYLSTFHAGDAANNYYNYFKNYDLMPKFLLPHYVYFDNNDMTDSDWELFKKEIRNPKVEQMATELTEALNKYKEKDYNDNLALIALLGGVYEFGKGVVKEMKESIKNADFSSSYNDENSGDPKKPSTTKEDCKVQNVPSYTEYSDGLKDNWIQKYDQYSIKFSDGKKGKIIYWSDDKNWAIYAPAGFSTRRDYQDYQTKEDAINALYEWESCGTVSKKGKK